MCKVEKRSFLRFVIATLVLAAAAAWSSAHATGDSSQQHATGALTDQAASVTTRSEMAACKTLPLSQRGICADQAGYGQPVMRRSLSPAQQQALDREKVRYEAAVAACKRLPASDRTTCMSQAGIDTNLAALK
jgi:hypothetical protein